MEANPPPAVHHRPLAKRLWYRLTQWVIGLVARVWFRLVTEGRHNAPESGPAVFVCNHGSHLDPLLVGVFCPRIICYFARETLFRGLFGVLIRSYDAIPVDQEGSALAGLRATLARVKLGDAVLVFPEGSRTLDGRFQPMMPGVLTLLRRGKASLIPTAINGAWEAMPYKASYPKPKKIAIVYGEAIPHEQLESMSNDAIMQLIDEQIRACFTRAAELAGRDPAYSLSGPGKEPALLADAAGEAQSPTRA
ncbi:1-acyl-sn-glycerol-3-phosphate acyltransferase [Posidoniimonas polymericola]|uniref:1-acyl-sn-glycerol-3-phosphate acyltransferase n=1 Tax=Posidoniimonas polymericola TaxID=2528002 RepID=A0A5C5YF53_9BACT|nr:lysophospholipid acyltransferase family protein [Posidoniimonas polymericola]TWT73559.1 1-acyl-sn-glycerol-3-phosphate acyltransferase [Posidoniimonas polymericola]